MTRISANRGLKMPAWFDMYGLGPDAKEDAPGIEKATKWVQNLIEEQISKGTPPERIFIGGFSQGGALAIRSALTFPKKLGGIIAFSTWLPLRNSFDESMVTANRDIPIFQSHGDQDPTVSYDFGHLSSELLKKFSKDINFKRYAGGDHEITSEGYDDMVDFFDKHIPAEVN